MPRAARNLPEILTSGIDVIEIIATPTYSREFVSNEKNTTVVNDTTDTTATSFRDSLFKTSGTSQVRTIIRFVSPNNLKLVSEVKRSRRRLPSCHPSIRILHFYIRIRLYDREREQILYDLIRTQ